MYQLLNFLKIDIKPVLRNVFQGWFCVFWRDLVWVGGRGGGLLWFLGAPFRVGVVKVLLCFFCLFVFCFFCGFF